MFLKINEQDSLNLDHVLRFIKFEAEKQEEMAVKIDKIQKGENENVGLDYFISFVTVCTNSQGQNVTLNYKFKDEKTRQDILDKIINHIDFIK